MISRKALLTLVAALLVLTTDCTASDPDPRGPEAPTGEGDGAVLSDGSGCAVSCAMVACGRFACQTKCLAGSGCTECTGLPCGSGVCHYGTGCNCAGQPCVSSGCPPGTGCLP
jgi:hypothetical protein